jgi:hypothetical protein
MRITSIETTPNPNSMKLNLDQSTGKRETYTQSQRQGCPEGLVGLLDINGLQSIFVCDNFVTLNRDPRSDWPPILETATRVLSTGDSQMVVPEPDHHKAELEGQVSVFVQTCRGIPIQVKVVGIDVEKRVSLGTRFNDAAQRIQSESVADYLKERYWADWGVRYGDAAAVATEVADEIAGTMDDKTLERIISEGLGNVAMENAPQSSSDLREQLNAPEWHSRLKAVQEIANDEAAVGLLTVALKDEHPQVRRLAIAALGATGSREAVEPLCKILLNDSSVAVRRTAGDALSDLGDVAAESAVCHALRDANKLVRWRAARFLADNGTKEALPYLSAAVADPEFEVRLEINAAIERINRGLEGSAPAWKRILENT